MSEFEQLRGMAIFRGHGAHLVGYDGGDTSLLQWVEAVLHERNMLYDALVHVVRYLGEDQTVAMPGDGEGDTRDTILEIGRGLTHDDCPVFRVKVVEVPRGPNDRPDTERRDQFEVNLRDKALPDQCQIRRVKKRKKPGEGVSEQG